MDLASGPRVLAVWTDAEAGVTLPSQARGLGQEGRCDLAASGRDGQGQHLAQGFWGELISAVGEEFGDLHLRDSPRLMGCTGPPRTPGARILEEGWCSGSWE